jgi:hypothetical protein
MNSRIFPTSRQDKPLDTKEVYSGIDYEKLPNAIAEIRSGKNEQKLDDLLKNILEANKRVAASKEEDDENDFAELEKSHVHEDDDEPQKGKFASVDDDEDVEAENEDEETDGDASDDEKNTTRKDVFANEKRVIRFTSADQINAAALSAAQAVNDKVLVRAILSARNDRRTAIAQKIVEATTTQMQREARLNTKTTKKVAASTEKPTAKQVTASTEKSRNGFKTVEKMSTAEKKLIALLAKEHDMPESYIESCFGVRFASTRSEDTSEVKAIKTVMASKMDVEVKKAAVSSMIKTSMLDKESENRVVHYWKDELKYGDAEWIQALVKDYKAE